MAHLRTASIVRTGKTAPAPAGDTSGLRAVAASTTRHGHPGDHAARCGERPALLQPKLTISDPNDRYEQEADRVAEQVMRMPDPAAPGSGVDPAPIRPLSLQRLCAECEDEQRRLHRRHDGTQPENTASGLDGVEANLRRPGQPLDPATRAFFEPRFGVDFSAVRVHTDSRAAASARSINALAYTVGRDVVFSTGQYAPHRESGRRLLAHELTHVVQQGGASDFIQRLIRTPYPWRGIITPAIGANIRSSPDTSSPANILDSIPRGQPVNVLSASGNWLRVESRYRGPLLVGYVHHTLVDDAASSSMGAAVGTTMVWRPSGPGSGTDFETWASAAAEAPFPPVTATTVMNCWEAVLLAAFRAGVINWNWIHNLYASVPMSDWVTAMSRGALRTYSVPGPNPHMPQRGDLVFFDGLAHVALATGRGSDVYTFWPPPNTPFTAGGTTDRVKVFTIEALVTWWTANMPPPAPAVEFAAPAW